jgi:hypothetical protein
MKMFARWMTLCFLLVSFACEAQMTGPSPSPLPPVPTTKVLAIGRLKGPRTPEVLKILSTREVPETVRLYLAGKIDQWYSLKNDNGVVFVLNVSSVEEAHSMLEALPLGQAKLMEFELIPIGPLSPLGLLLPKEEKAAQ